MEVLDLGDIREEADTPRVKVHSLTKRYISSIPPVVPLFVQPTPSLGPRLLDIFAEDDDMVHIV